MNGLIKFFLAGIVAVFVLLFAVSTLLPPPASEYAEAKQYFTDQEVAIGRQFAFERRLFFWGGTALELGLLLTLVATGAARRLADLFSRWTGYRADAVTTGGSRLARLRSWAGNLLRWLATLLLVAATYAILHELLRFPVSVGRFYHSRAWGMTGRPFGEWLNEYLLSVGVTLTAEAIGGIGLYLLLRWLPRMWYLWGAIAGVAFGFATAYLMPVVVAPLFNTFTPLSETEWAPLETPLRRLAAEAGVPVDRIYVADASRQGNHTNAYFTGMGSSQSIVLYDTLLKQHPPAEVESILAHEIGHWTHHHIVKGILLGGLAALVGLIVMDRILRWFLHRPPLFLGRLDDPAGVPLVLLLAYLGAWLAMPLENLVSRHFERQADTTSLELAGMPEVFIRAEQRLAIDNKGNVVPEPWNVWLFSTHPPTLERIEMARQWEQLHGKRSNP
jgi:STE24 endopeptidase